MIETAYSPLYQVMLCVLYCWMREHLQLHQRNGDRCSLSVTNPVIERSTPRNFGSFRTDPPEILDIKDRENNIYYR